MHHLFYREFVEKRVNKIINILGEDWFAHKTILELGACHGDVGIEFMKLGADVIFSDARLDSLKDIENKIFFSPKLAIIDQNEKYYIDEKIDLVLHLGVLNHVENWKQDLECALSHSNITFLETVVSTNKDDDYILEVDTEYKYDGVSNRRPIFSQEAVERHILSLGYKFLRIDSSELDTNWGWLHQDRKVKHCYSWNYNNIEQYKNQENQESEIWFRRFWLIIK